VDKVSKTPRTYAVKSYQERCEMLHGDKIVTHAMCFARASEEADEFHSLCEKLEEELAAQKEQFRVLEDELLVLGDERNAAVARSNLLACALRSLLLKCTCCGGTGEVATGHIQMGIPALMSCFVCAGERGILLKECGK
jgi:hypothetical protein